MKIYILFKCLGRKAIDKIKKFFRIDSLKKGWLLSMAVIIAMLSIGTGYFLFGIVRHEHQQAVDGFARISEVSAENLSELLNSSQDAAKLAGYSNAVQKYLLLDDPGEVIGVSASVRDLLNTIDTYGNGFKDICLYSERGRKISLYNLYNDIVSKAFKASGEESVYFKKSFYSVARDEKNKEYIVYFFPVYGIIDGYRYRYNPIYGAIVYDIDDLLDNLVSSNYSEGNAVLLSNDQVIGSTRELSKDEYNDLLKADIGNFTGKIGSESCLVSVSEQKETGWKLVYFAPTSSLIISYGGVGNQLLFLMFLAVLLTVIIIVLLLSFVRKDIWQLTEDIRASAVGSGAVQLPRLLEIRPIAGAFNEVMDDLHTAVRKEQELTIAQYEAKLAQTNAEMLAYRSQINPHFLFNTLESVRSLAHRYGAEPIEQLVGGMSCMCRYSLYSTMVVKVEDELGHLGAYFSIMDVRFPGRYRIMEKIDPNVLLWPSLSMMLQPIAENVVLHAFTGRKYGTIMVQAFIKDDSLHIRIADNGIGMDEDVLENVQGKINSGLTDTAHINGISDHGPEYKISIGLPNINRRLKLAFGDQASLSIRSRKGYYTVVEIIIPGDK